MILAGVVLELFAFLAFLTGGSSEASGNCPSNATCAPYSVSSWAWTPLSIGLGLGGAVLLGVGIAALVRFRRAGREPPPVRSPRS
jgi:hypothetical protein